MHPADVQSTDVMLPGSKAKNHDVLAQKWFYGLMTRPNMGQECESAKHGTIRKVAFFMCVKYFKPFDTG